MSWKKRAGNRDHVYPQDGEEYVGLTGETLEREYQNFGSGHWRAGTMSDPLPSLTVAEGGYLCNVSSFHNGAHVPRNDHLSSFRASI